MRTVDVAAAQKIDQHAYSPYAPFESGSVGLRQLIRFSLKRFWRQDLAFTLAAGAVGGVLGLAVPLATGILFDFYRSRKAEPARSSGSSCCSRLPGLRPLCFRLRGRIR